MTTPSTNSRYLVPDLAEFISRRMEDMGARFNCMLPGIVKSFDSDTQMATIQIVIQKIIKGVIPLNSVGQVADKSIDYPILIQVPVIFLFGGGAFLSFPIADGDECLVFFSDRDMSIWINDGQIAPPNSERKHNVNDAVALVGIRPLTNSNSDYDSTKSKWGFPDGLLTAPDRTGERLCQSGFILPFGGSSAPDGWLLCYGQSISKTTYPDLFAVTGYAYGGSGDNFNVPDLRGRSVFGKDNMGGSNANVLTSSYNSNRNTLGGTIGEETHTLTVAELATHHHSISMTQENNGGASFAQGAPAGTPASINTGDTGSSSPHQNVPPGMVLNWIIKI